MAEKNNPPETLRFDYLKSALFRTIHCDGVFGGVSPRGKVWMTLWSERGAIPTQIAHSVKDGKLGPEIASERVTRDAFVREAESVVILDVEVARSLRQWLDEKLKVFDEAAKESKSSGPAPAGGVSDAKH